jgi:phosphopentomutase
LIDLLYQQGKKTAAFYNWEPLRDISRPGALDASFCLNNSMLPGYQDGRGDIELTEVACRWLGTHPVDFSFVYLGCSDAAGHTYGWMSDGYLRTVANAWQCIHRVCSVLPPDSTIIIASDHGGHTRHHGTDQHEDMTIPIIMNGPQISQGLRIDNPASILDITPTIFSLFDIQAPPEWEGKVLK